MAQIKVVTNENTPFKEIRTRSPFPNSAALLPCAVYPYTLPLLWFSNSPSENSSTSIDRSATSIVLQDWRTAWKIQMVFFTVSEILSTLIRSQLQIPSKCQTRLSYTNLSTNDPSLVNNIWNCQARISICYEKMYMQEHVVFNSYDLNPTLCYMYKNSVKLRT